MTPLIYTLVMSNVLNVIRRDHVLETYLKRATDAHSLVHMANERKTTIATDGNFIAEARGVQQQIDNFWNCLPIIDDSAWR